MAELAITPGEVNQIAADLALPFHFKCQRGGLRISGSIRIIWNQPYAIDLRFRRIRGERIVFEITGTNPSFGVFDNLIKTRLARWLNKRVNSGVTLDYPLVVIAPREFPGLQSVFDQVEITDLTVTPQHVRIHWQFREISASEPGSSSQTNIITAE